MPLTPTGLRYARTAIRNAQREPENLERLEADKIEQRIVAYRKTESAVE
jgi:hypothetical protein